VFTAQYALSPYIKQIRFVFKGLNTCTLYSSTTCFGRVYWPPSSRNYVQYYLTTFHFMVSEFLPDDSRNTRPKHVVDENKVHVFKYCVCSDNQNNHINMELASCHASGGLEF
jgi:hypothetical protein